MTFVTNDPIFWSLITFERGYSYYIVASTAAVAYDWVLTLGQEFDLIWRQRWSFMTFLYLGVRYSGALLCGIQILMSCASGLVHLTDLGCTIISIIGIYISVITNAMVGAIMIARLYAMYQQSRTILILLVLIYSAITISCVVLVTITGTTAQFEEFILSGNYVCYGVVYNQFLTIVTWILGALWEVFALSLAIWIAIKHFRELPAGWTTEDCFKVLMRSHVFYFASIAAVACFILGELSPSVNTLSTGAQTYNGVLQILSMVQMFVIAPRLILSMREYNAKVVAESDEATAMTSIAFQARTQRSNGNDV